MIELAGKYLYGIYISDDATVLKFQTSAGDIAYRADADCCSESWFSHISPLPLVNSKWRSVEIISVTVRDEVSEAGTRQDEDKVYSFDLNTSEGAITIEMRNSSNGYYGGSIMLTVDVPKDMKLVEKDI